MNILYTLYLCQHSLFFGECVPAVSLINWTHALITRTYVKLYCKSFCICFERVFLSLSPQLHMSHVQNCRQLILVFGGIYSLKN
jgi:hypothetical protein